MRAAFFVILASSHGAMLVPAAVAQATDELQQGIRAFERGEYEQAARLLVPHADAGQPEALYRVGVMQRYGYGIPDDMDTAIRTLRRAAERGHAPSQAELGSILFTRMRFGGDVEPADVLRWLNAAIERGEPMAMDVMSVFLNWPYAHLAGVGRDDEYARTLATNAIAIYRARAQQGDTWAMYWLSGLLLGAAGLPANEAEANRWLELSANRNNRAAQFSFGLQLLCCDPATGWMWLILSQREGHGAGRLAVERERWQFSEQERAAGERRALSWRPALD